MSTTTPFNAVAAAYNSASRLIGESGRSSLPGLGDKAQTPDFGQLLASDMRSVVDSGNVSDQLSLDLVNGKANVVDVVTAISQTEMAMESMVTIRDRVISAYEEIKRRPI